MAIQPIDLSTMYSQMDKVAQFATKNQTAQIANQQNIERATQQNLEKSKTVQQAENDATSVRIKQDGRQGASANDEGEERKEKAKKEEPPIEEKKAQWEFTDPRLGQRIDITR